MEEKLKVVQDNPQLQEILSQFPEIATEVDPLARKQALLAAMAQRPDLFRPTVAHKEGELDEEGGMYVTPTKGYVLKTADAKTGEKVFLNICSHEIIDAPEEKELPEVQGDQQIGLRIPLSLGNPRPDFDKSNLSAEGQICTVYDIILNPDVTAKTKADAAYRGLLLELCISYIQQKHGQALTNSERYAEYRMPRMKYKGKTVEMQRVKGKKQPKIEVMDRTVFEREQGAAAPEWELEVDGQPLDPEALEVCSGLGLRVKLPMLVTGHGITIDLSAEHVSIQAGKMYSLQLWLPRKVDPTSASASFSCTKRELVLLMPIHTGEVVEMDTEVPAAPLKPVALPEHDLLFDIV